MVPDLLATLVMNKLDNVFASLSSLVSIVINAKTATLIIRLVLVRLSMFFEKTFFNNSGLIYFISKLARVTLMERFLAFATKILEVRKSLIKVL